MKVPDGWTDDLNLPLEWKEMEQIVDFVYVVAEQEEPQDSAIERLMSTYRLSREDATLAIDRALGGVVRAATGNPKNRPKKETDPVAWISFNRCQIDPTIIARIYPQLAARKKGPWWKFWTSR